MNGSNSFNICPRCGNSNALNAKYCSRCGAQLKVPEEPVVCHKCHTRNTPMANFCRNCGTTLKVGAETKICPKCGKEVNADENVCVCGYSFVTLQQTVPSNSPVEATDSVAPVDTSEVTESKKVYNTKGGRGWAIAAVVLILLFAYYVIAPYVVTNYQTLELEVSWFKPSFLPQLDKGFVNQGGAETALYGYNFIESLVLLVLAVVSGEVLGDVIGELSIGNFMMAILTVVFLITVVAHFIVAFVRCFTAKRSKRMNWFFLIVAILTTLLVGMITLCSYVKMDGFMATVASWFAVPEPYTLGYAIWAIPLYFWFFYLYSLCAKAKVLKEKAA